MHEEDSEVVRGGRGGCFESLQQSSEGISSSTTCSREGEGPSAGRRWDTIAIPKDGLILIGLLCAEAG